MTLPHLLALAQVSLIPSVVGACPGETVVFTCIVSGSTLRWEIGGVVSVDLDRTSGPIPLGDFILNVTGFTSDSMSMVNSITSTATGSATEDTNVTCIDASLVPVISMTANLLVAGECSQITLLLLDVFGHTIPLTAWYVYFINMSMRLCRN